MILQRLREETSDEHRRIEGEMDLLRAGWTKREVGGLVERMYGFYEPWERIATDALSANGMTAVMEGRRKVPALEADLRTHRGESMDLLSVPRCDRMPDMSSVGKVLGSMYVLEGSTLGGQIISRHFQQHVPGLEDGRGCSFFGCYGPAVGMMWREFQGVLVNHSSPETDDEMVSAARQTFELLRTWLHDTVGASGHQ